MILQALEYEMGKFFVLQMVKSRTFVQSICDVRLWCFLRSFFDNMVVKTLRIEGQSDFF